jgi:transketolase
MKYKGVGQMNTHVKKIKGTANEIRRDIVKMIAKSGSGHPGGSLSAADILASLYFGAMNVDCDNPKMTGRDKFVLSKGHAAPVLYSTLARKGYFPIEELDSLRKTGALLQGHPCMKTIPGVEMSTGSLGQGFSTSVGMAIAARLNDDNGRVFVLLGDGELNEGIVWEAAMSAAQFKLSNLTAILDFNGLQIDGKNDEVMGVSPVDDKFRAFGWNVVVTDGHSVEEILSSVEKARTETSKPTIIIAHTIKGKGVSFMEDKAGWHGKAPSAEELEIALNELSALDGGNK